MHTFTGWLFRVGLLGLFLLAGSPCWAQYNTPTLDGNIGAGEYGNQTNGQNQQQTNNGSTTWYMTWDATYLYLAINGADDTNASFTYLDINPIVPVNGGDNSNGSLQGINFDQHNFSALPFRADYAVFAKTGSGGQQLLRADGNGGWTSAGTFDTYFNGRVRELRIAWANLGGFAPSSSASFNWLGYLDFFSNGRANIFGAIPTLNPYPTNTDVQDNNSLVASYYYTVSSTANSAATPPFSQTSYTYPINSSSSNNSFGGISVFDFTMNTSGQQISRAGGDWTIAGTLTVGNGSVYFGSGGSYGSTSVGNVAVSGGLLSLDHTNQPLVASGNVTVSGGTLQLSSADGGDLKVAGNFTLSGGTFTPNLRAVFLTGTAQTLTGSTATPLAFDYLLLSQQGSGSTATLATDASVSQQLSFGMGQLVTNANVLDLGTTGVFVNESTTSNLLGYSRSTKVVGAGTAAQVDFGQMGLRLTPVGSSAALGRTVVTRSRGLAPLTGAGSSQSIQRNFRIVPSGGTDGVYDVNLAFNYFDSELNGIAENNLQLFYSLDAVTMPPGGGTFAGVGGTDDPSANTVTQNDLNQFGQGTANGAVYTLGDQTNPLPVTLVSFDGTRTAGGAVRLSWRTAQETANAGFGLERQAGAGQWAQVAFVPGTGTSQGQAYQYLDATAPAGTLYYRLRQVDASGATSYSPVATVAPASAGTGAQVAQVLLSPVPTPAGQALTVDLSTLPAAARTLSVYDLQGRLLLQATAAAEEQTAPLAVNSLAAGTYLVLVQGADGSYRARFTKL